MNSSVQELPDDLKSTLIYTIEVFSFLLLRNESIQLSEFARRISEVTSPCKRTLLGIHSLLAVDGTIERRYDGIALHGIHLRMEQADFPIFDGWGKWSEERVRLWLNDQQGRLAEAGISYSMVA